MVREERSRWEIIHDVLAVTSEEKNARKTKIMQRAYLNTITFHRYFDFLVAEGFIAKCNSEDESYELTGNGRELYKKLKELRNLFDLAKAYK